MVSAVAPSLHSAFRLRSLRSRRGALALRLGPWFCYSVGAFWCRAASLQFTFRLWRMRTRAGGNFGYSQDLGYGEIGCLGV